MKKFGFTLAEVLITLSIVGIVSALTIPNFVANAQNKANAAKLSATITTLETVFSNMMADEAVAEFNETIFIENHKINPSEQETANILAKYLKINKFEKNLTNSTYKKEQAFKEMDGRVAAALCSTGVYTLKNGAVLILGTSQINTITEEEAEKLGVAVTSQDLFLTIDVNGTDSPNIFSRDVFIFLVGNDGKLYPCGSKVYSALLKKDLNSVYTNVNGDFPCDGGKYSAGCAARLVENNFVVDY